MPEQILISEAARRLNLSRARVYVLADRGAFGPVDRSPHKHATVSADAVQAWGEANLQRRLALLAHNRQLRMRIEYLRIPASGAPSHEAT